MILLRSSISITFCLFLFISVSYAKSSVSFDSLAGIVEIQRAGNVKWEYASKSSKLFHNDLVRIPDTGIAVLKWPDGTRSFIHKKSQILITLVEKKNSTNVVSNVTIMFGAAFFIVKKLLPKDRTEEMKVYTPTAVLSIRGTSFLVDVDTVEKNTKVKMVNGLLMVKNISKNVSVLLGTPFQTEVAADQNPVSPSAVLKSDLDSMKLWIPGPVIEEEIARQIESTTQNKIELSGDYQDRCLVAQFTNSSKYNGKWDIAQEFTRQLSSQLRRTLSKTVVMLVDTIVNDPLETAKSINARFCISGTIDNFDLVKRAAISTKGDEYRETVSARVTVTVRMHDLVQNKDIVSNSFTSELQGKNTAENSWDTFHKKAFNLSDTSFTKSIIGYVSVNSLTDAAKAVSKEMEK
jgi:FecR protein